MKNSRVSILVVILMLATGVVALGHNLWVTADGSRVQIVFEHSPSPGKGTYNATILRNGKTWAHGIDSGEVSPVVMEEVGEPGSLSLAGSTTVMGPRAIEHSCLFGIYRGRLDYFYGKFLDVAGAEQLETLGRASKLPLDIVPELHGAVMELRVLWQGQLLADHMFGVVTPDGEEASLERNDEGRFVFELTQPGVYGFWAIRMDDETEGVHEGKAYSGTMHGSTLSVRWPLGGGGE